LEFQAKLGKTSLEFQAKLGLKIPFEFQAKPYLALNSRYRFNSKLPKQRLPLKHHLHTLFTNAIAHLQTIGKLPPNLPLETVRIERSREKLHGDFACNAAMVLAKAGKMRPRDLAAQLLEQLPTQEKFIAHIEIAGPGFINIFLTPAAYYTTIDEALHAKEHFGENQLGKGQTVHIEFVSANPTGPLHVGHGRGAAYGMALSNLLTAANYQVFREYYVNDAGRQMDILATSVWLRYLELGGQTVAFPAKGYQGDYIWDIAASLHREHGNTFHHPTDQVWQNLPADNQPDEHESHIDALIERCKHLLGDTAYQQIFQRSLNVILDDIRQDLEQFGVIYDNWFFESTLTANNSVRQAIERLKTAGHTYEQDGALWFRSTAFGDEKDRVMIRDNGQLTYFATDIAYHLNKLERGYHRLINIWGADHHGYFPRVKAAIMALNAPAERLTVLLVQFVTLYRGAERAQMSTRSGEYITLRQLRNEVGRDAARFFYVERKSEQHLDFDLELATSQKNDNPVYYVQYAHARIASIFRELRERQWEWQHHSANLAWLTTPHEQALLITVSRYPEVVELATLAHEPHQITYYLRELAQDFHTYYNEHKILVAESELRNARLSLCAVVKQILINGLKIIGVSAPEVM
jgi:arginyl-tRNA synthetase